MQLNERLDVFSCKTRGEPRRNEPVLACWSRWMSLADINQDEPAGAGAGAVHCLT